MVDAIRLILDWSELRSVGFDAVIYSAVAMIGTLLFFIRLLLGLFLGVEGMAEADVEVDSEGSAAFGIFSFLSITAFLMTTGWVGLATRLDAELPPALSGLRRQLLMTRLVRRFGELETGTTPPTIDQAARCRRDGQPACRPRRAHAPRG